MNNVLVYGVGGASAPVTQTITKVVKADDPIVRTAAVSEGHVVTCPACDALVLVLESPIAELTVKLPKIEVDGKILTITATQDIYSLSVVDDKETVLVDSMLESGSVKLLGTVLSGWVRV